MRKFREFCRDHYGQSVEMKYRMFCICSVLGTITSFLGAVLCSIIAGFDEPVSYATISAFIMMFALTVLGHRIQKVDTILIIMSSFLNFIAFPMAFFTTGALYSVAPMFFVMGIFIAVPILNKYKRNVLFLLQLIFYSCVISVCYFYPQISYFRPQKVHTTMLLFSFIIVTFYTVFATIMITNQYEKEQAKVRLLNGLLEKQATLDPLTKLYNRRYLTEFVDQKLQEEKPQFLITIVDIDNFKKVNDNYGHTTGDQVLLALADAMTNVFPESCFVCRYGGEEFLIYCGTIDMKLVEHWMDMVKKQFLEICQERFSIAVTFSAGAAVYEDGMDMAAIIDRADVLLYKAKHSGKDQFLCR